MFPNNNNSNPSRITIKLKPRGPVRSSVGPAEGATAGSVSAAAAGNAVVLSAAAAGTTVSIPPSHTPEALARSSPFWDAAMGMVDIVLNPARLALVLQKEEAAASVVGNEGTASAAAAATVARCEGLLSSPQYAYSCEEVCTAVRCICDLGASEALFKELHARLSAYISTEVKALVASVEGDCEKNNTNNNANNNNGGGAANKSIEQRAIEGVVALWSGVIRNVLEISTVFMYLDRRYVLQETREGSIFNVGVHLFKSEIMFRGRAITTKANAGFLQLLEEDRASERKMMNSNNHNGKTAATTAAPAAAGTATQHYLTRYRDMTLAVQLYFSELEPLIVEHSHKAYTEMGNALLMGQPSNDAEEEEESDNAVADAKNKKKDAPTSSVLAAAGAAAAASSISDSDSDDDEGMASAKTFFIGAERLIQSEHRRITRFLDNRSRPKLDEALQLRLVKPFVPALFESDFAKLVAKNRLEDVARGFKLMCLRHVNEKDKAKAAFTAFAKKWAAKFVADIGKEEDDDAFIPNVIALDDALNTIIEAAFTPGYDEEFQTAKTSAFEAALQNKEQRVSQLLVKYMDGFLRTPSSTAHHHHTHHSHAHAKVGSRTRPTAVIIGSAASAANANAAADGKRKEGPTSLYVAASPVVATPLTAGGGFPAHAAIPTTSTAAAADSAADGAPSVVETEEDIMLCLDKALRIFVYMPSKDIFEAFYLREFSNRVLCRRSASTDVERYVIAKLRGLCGSNLTKQLDGMLRDLDISLEQTDAFRRMVRDREEGRLDAYGTLIVAADGGTDGTTTTSVAAAASSPTEKSETAAAAAAKEEKKLLPPCPKIASAEGALLLNTTVSTLTQSFWPFFNTFTPSAEFFPRQCTAVMAQFEAFYDLQFRRRSLTWVHALAQSTVRAVYGTSVSSDHKDLHGSFLQGLILGVCFPQRYTSTTAETEMTFGEILRRVCKVDEKTGAPVPNAVGVRTNPSAVILAKAQQAEAAAGIVGTTLTADEYLVRQLVVCALLGLLTPKLPILLRGAAPTAAGAVVEPLVSTESIFGSDVKDSDVFRVNTKFTNKLRSIRVPQILPRDGMNSRMNKKGGANGAGGDNAMAALGGVTDEALLKKLESQRQYLLDATIAKVMKARHSCGHADLVAEVLKAVSHRFATDGAAVKVRIEELIKRSFIERDANDSAVYHFKA